MIKGTIRREEDGRIVSFEMRGHANAGPYGSDIVCAGVSALTFSTVNGIEALAGIIPIVEIDVADEGYLYFETEEDITQEQSNIAQILLENLVLGLQGIQEEHSDYLNLETVTKK
ncbi:ribosomal-processing cysteine protease Prp [Vagococcus intermedius]|uniref:Ribosomal processing cysteine protease Prp n=1 Tax=Vagococcus intermedius TaxID=2991418 RepID=A0AAF0I9V9_9ENTE|nr:ribosomal-processing cysteine protease Prp [Vagococcus intermedius]WEG73832.1 ribosomal-processing cysteine protease Prp [Vagococcus intermedius]WEG75917.1 ribosomal-processing cysteine protease Prp [Vagococcus intermedius]